jgi:hypothetical protein
MHLQIDFSDGAGLRLFDLHFSSAIICRLNKGKRKCLGPIRRSLTGRFQQRCGTFPKGIGFPLLNNREPSSD